MYPDGLGELVLGVVVMATAAGSADVRLGLTDRLLIRRLVLCAVVIHAAMKMHCRVAGVWTTSTLRVLTAVNQLSDFAAYPMTPCHPALSALLTWVVPYAFTAAISVQYLLFSGAGLLGLLPVAAVLAAVSAVAFARVSGASK